MNALGIVGVGFAVVLAGCGGPSPYVTTFKAEAPAVTAALEAASADCVTTSMRCIQSVFALPAAGRHMKDALPAADGDLVSNDADVQAVLDLMIEAGTRLDPSDTRGTGIALDVWSSHWRSAVAAVH